MVQWTCPDLPVVGWTEVGFFRRSHLVVDARWDVNQGRPMSPLPRRASLPEKSGLNMEGTHSYGEFTWEKHGKDMDNFTFNGFVLVFQVDIFSSRSFERGRLMIQQFWWYVQKTTPSLAQNRCSKWCKSYLAGSKFWDKWCIFCFAELQQDMISIIPIAGLFRVVKRYVMYPDTIRRRWSVHVLMEQHA